MKIEKKFLIFHSSSFIFIHCSLLFHLLGVPLAGRAFGTASTKPPPRPQRLSKLIKVVALWLTESASIPHASLPAPAVGCGSSTECRSIKY